MGWLLGADGTCLGGMEMGVLRHRPIEQSHLRAYCLLEVYIELLSVSTAHSAPDGLKERPEAILGVVWELE